MKNFPFTAYSSRHNDWVTVYGSREDQDGRRIYFCKSGTQYFNLTEQELVGV